MAFGGQLPGDGGARLGHQRRRIDAVQYSLCPGCARVHAGMERSPSGLALAAESQESWAPFACNTGSRWIETGRRKLDGAPPPRPRGSSLFLSSFAFSRSLSSLGLPFLAATTGRTPAPSVTSSPGPLPAPSIHQVCPPLLSPSAVRNGAPQNLTKLFVLGSE
jgi:hypothetical protein